jgi:formate hydrogenlyase subunit 6/NADH:ubiquinone oxidoreductase subunit I
MSISTSRSPSRRREPGDDAVRGRALLRIEASALEALIGALRTRGHRVVAPVVRDGHLVHEEVRSAAELSPGWRDAQGPGRYRLERDPRDAAIFGPNVGPQSWKTEFFPERLTLLRMARRDGAWSVEASAADAAAHVPPALLGIRSCDVAALAVHDRVLGEGLYPDRQYVERRRDAFIATVDCARAGATCFCSSTHTGPAATHGYDLALTEVVSKASHHFVVRVGSQRGAAVMEDVPHRAASGVVARTDAAMHDRTLDMEQARHTLLDSLESPHWDDVAARCLSCGNCTMVCPTCFCSTVEDSADLDGDHAERTRVWDTCFALSHSYIHGGSVRPTTSARYRQWITHKLATWVDQFGVSGCVGCGRCTTWCPVGIDIVAEVKALDAARPAAEATT